MSKKAHSDCFSVVVVFSTLLLANAKFLIRDFPLIIARS